MSRELAAGLVGAAIGGAIGGPTGAMYGYSIGSAVGAVAFAEKPPNQEGPRLKDLNVITSQEGAPIPSIYGGARTSGNVIWGKPLQEHKKKKKAGGGKGGGAPKVTTYTYTLDFAMGIDDKPIAGIVRMWDNGKLILDASPLTAAEQAIVDAGGFLPDAVAKYSSFFNKTTELIGGGSIRVYPGSETQMPDPLIEADLGVGNTPAYRGLAYIVFDNYPTRQMPNITVEVVGSGTGGLQYLGKQGPFSTLTSGGAASDTDIEIYSHYVRPDSTLACVSWHSSFGSNAAYAADPLRIYSSGLSQYGARHPKSGWTGNRLVASYCDTPAYFSQNTGVSGNPIFLYSVSGGATQLIGSFVGPSTLSVGGRQTSVHYVDGEVWIYYNGDKKIYSGLPQGAMLADDAHSTLVVRGVVSDIVPNAIKGVWINADEIYVVSFLSPNYTIYVIDRDSFTLTTTIPMGGAPTTEKDEVRMYSQAAGVVYFLFETSITSTHVGSLYVLDGGVVSLVGDISPLRDGVSDSHCWSVDAGIVTVFSADGASASAQADLGEIRYWAINTLSGNAVPLSTIVADVCESAGLDSSFVNVTDLASTMVKGYIRNAQMTARAALEPLATGFFFDAVESGATLTFRRRGGPVVDTISADDLGTTMGDTPVDRTATTIVQDNELPIELDLQYIDPARDYQVGSQRSRRQIPASEKVSSVTMPIVWTGTEAKQAVEKLHYTAWEERNQYKLSLPIRYLALEPGDAITVPVNGFNRRLRITRTDLGNTLECEAVSDFAASYVSEAVAASNPTGPQVIKVPGTTIAVLLDIPILADSDNDAGLYIAAMGTGSGWTGAEIFKSVDGVSYESVDSITSESTIGGMVDLLPAGSTTVWDDGPAVKVRLLEGTLSSVTDLEAMAGANTAAIGANGRWEIVSFANAVLNGDGTYSLSRRIRGRKGTEWAVGLHAASDTFVLLEEGDLIRNVPATSDIGAARYYKAVSFGSSDGDTMNYTHQAVGLEPYAPAHISGNLASGDWTISWVRRNRIDGEWRDYVDVPMSEASESYEVDILRDGVVLRTLASATPTVTYPNAQMVTDFGFVKPMIDTKIYQLSSTVGRGYPASTTLLAPSATVMHLKFDGVDGSTSIIDEKKHTFTASGTARLTAVDPLYGPTSLLLDGAGGLVTSADHVDWELSGEDLTIEGFIRPSAASIAQVIAAKRVNSASIGSFVAMISSDNRIRLYASINGTAWDLDMYSGPNIIAANTTYHFAFCRKGNSWYGLLDGAVVSSGSLSGALVNNASSLFVGADGDGANPFLGRIGPIRMLRGAALYAGAYTVPVPPF